MIQIKYDNVMKRYDITVPYNLADEKQEMVTVETISENNKINLHKEISLKLMRQILLTWDEYEHQITREFASMFEDTEKGDK